MARKPEKDFVVPPILIELIEVITSGAGQKSSWGANKCEPNGVIRALIGTVLWASENCGAVRAALVRQIDPVV